jgi:uncharacterized cupredoxin-like copper-binding protein
MRKISILALVGLLVGSLLAACAGQAAEPTSFDIQMNEFSYNPQTINVTVGQEVTLNLKNDGVLEHELMIGRDVVTQDGRPNGFQQDLFAVAGVEPEISGGDGGGNTDDDHMHDNPGVMVTVPPSDQGSLKFVVTQEMVGEWEMGCFSQEGVHYTAGMTGKFVVTP